MLNQRENARPCLKRCMMAIVLENLQGKFDDAGSMPRKEKNSTKSTGSVCVAAADYLVTGSTTAVSISRMDLRKEVDGLTPKMLKPRV